MENYYSINDIITFKIIGKVSHRLELEYENFKSDRVDHPDFIVYLGKFTPSKTNCQILDGKYYVKYNYIYCEDTYKTGRWKLEISGIEDGDIAVRLDTNIIGSIAADMFICGFTIDPLIRFIMNKKGYSAVHAAAISLNGQAYLFPAQSGVGKTSTAVYFTQEGFSFLGDDFVILHEGHVIGYFSPLNIFAYNLNPVIAKKMGIMNNNIIKLKNLLYKATHGYIKIFSKLNPKVFFPTDRESDLKGIFFLTQGTEFASSLMNRSDLLEQLSINYEMESFPSYLYMLEYAYAFPNSNVAAYWKSYKINLNRNIPNNLPIYRVDVPRQYNKETFGNILRLVRNQK